MTLTDRISSGSTEDENRYLSNAEENHSISGEVVDNNIAASTTQLSFHRRCGELITLSSRSNAQSTNSFASDSGRR